MKRLSRTLSDFKIKADDTFENYDDEAYINLVKDKIIKTIEESARDRLYTLSEDKISKILEEISKEDLDPEDDYDEQREIEKMRNEMEQRKMNMYLGG